jgi:hypothetical protein
LQGGILKRPILVWSQSGNEVFPTGIAPKNKSFYQVYSGAQGISQFYFRENPEKCLLLMETKGKLKFCNCNSVFRFQKFMCSFARFLA